MVLKLKDGFIYIIVSPRDEIGEKVESAIYMKNPLK